MDEPNFIHLGPKPLKGTHVADGIVPITPSPEQHPAEQQFRVLSDLSTVGRWIVRILAFVAVPLGVLLLSLIAAAIAGCGSPSPRPSPVPDLPARVDVLAVARLLPGKLDELDARLRWGAGRVEFWCGVAFQSGPAIALGLNRAERRIEVSDGQGQVQGRGRDGLRPREAGQAVRGLQRRDAGERAVPQVHALGRDHDEHRQPARVGHLPPGRRVLRRLHRGARSLEVGLTSATRTQSPGERVVGVDGSHTREARERSRPGPALMGASRLNRPRLGMAAGRRGSAEGGPPTPAAAAKVYGPDGYRRATRSAARVPGLVSRPRYQADHVERPTSRCSSAQSRSDGGRRPARTPRVAGLGARPEAPKHRSTSMTAPAVPATHVVRSAEGSSDSGSTPDGSNEFAAPTGALLNAGGRRPEVSASVPPSPGAANVEMESTETREPGARFEAVSALPIPTLTNLPSAAANDSTAALGALREQSGGAP